VSWNGSTRDARPVYQLGYPADETIPELYARLGREPGTGLRGGEAEAYEALIHEAEGNLEAAFDLKPEPV